MAAKRDDSGPVSALAGVVQGYGFYVILSLLLVGGVVAALSILWQRWGERIAGGEQYILQADGIIVPPLPPWIHADVKGEAIRDGRLEGLSLLDPESLVKVATAFELNSWVAEVERVSKKTDPPRVLVEIRYRKPVALVEVMDSGRRALQPVDAEGVVLPTDLFLHDETQIRNFPRIVIDYRMPTGLEGTGWGDPRIVGAARVAYVLDSVWKKLGIYRIVSLGETARSSSAPLLYELHTKGVGRAIWGHPPGLEPAGEATAAEKVRRLVEFVERNGPLESSNDLVDLRPEEGMKVSPRTAQLVPLP